MSSSVAYICKVSGSFGKNFFINDSMIIATDIEASNGVVHLIDSVLIPEGLSADADMDNMPSIVDLVVNDARFSILKDLLIQADLVDALANGEFTVFAPTNAAFEALPAATLEAVQNDNKLLTDILTYHVIAGSFDSKALVNTSYFKTLSGQFAVVTQNNGLSIANAELNLDNLDIQASNGIVHVINDVMLPPMKTIVGTAQAAGNFTTLLAAAQAAGLVDALNGPGPLTVFAPTDAAFAKIQSTVEDLLTKPEVLRQVLLYHVIEGNVFSKQVLASDSFDTLQGSSIDISLDGTAKVNNANIVATDIVTTNGVIHVIDSVLVPNL